MFIVSLRYLKPLTEIDKFLAEHRAFLQAHYDAGHLLMSGPKEPRDGGIIIACVDTRAKLDSIINADPFHREQLAEYQVTEFQPVKTAPMLAEFRVSA